MTKENRKEKIEKLRTLYEEFKKIPFPHTPLAPDFADWDATIAGIASSYIAGKEKDIATPLSIEDMLDNYEREMRDDDAKYKPSSDEDVKEFLAYKNKLDGIVRILKELR